MPTYTAQKPESQSFAVSAGKYRVRVAEATEKTSEKGNDMIELKLRIIKNDGTDGPCVFDYLVFSQKSFWKVDAFLLSAGKHPGEGKTVNVHADDLIGYEAYADLSVEKYNGKDQNKVAAYIFETDGF